jgi:hypothetical protein
MRTVPTNGPPSRRPVNTAVQAEHKRDTPRELLLAAIVDVTAEHGYEDASVFELLYRQLRESRQPEIAGVLAPLIHLSLTPFLGPIETNRFIEGKLELAQSEPRRQPAAASTEE